MSTIRNIERRMFIRRQVDRDLQGGAAQPLAVEGQRGLEWNGIWAGYLVWAGCEAILLFLALGASFSTLNPMRASSWASVGGGTVVFAAIMTFIATYLGAWVCGRTPQATIGHGIAKSLPLWGLIMLTIFVCVGLLASQAVHAAPSGAATAVATMPAIPAAGAAVPAAGHTTAAAIPPSAAQFRTALQAQGAKVTQAQAATIETELAAGNTTGAAAALSRDAHIPVAKARTTLAQMKTSPAAAPPARAAIPSAVPTAVPISRHSHSVSWAMFWIALITLGCAIGGGATGGGGLGKRPKAPRQPAPKPAA